MRRTIERAGVHGAKWDLLVAKERTPVERAVFAMPVMRDFSATHQWLRELRSWHGEKMIAVHVRLASSEPVLVGRYGKEHARAPLSQAIAKVAADPWGMEIVVPRAIKRSEVAALREVTQLVGWTQAPADTQRIDCVCIACVPRGSRTLMRRVRAAYDHGLSQVRAAQEPHEIDDAIGRLDVPLERAKGRIPPTKLLPYARSPHGDVRVAMARVLSLFRPVDVEPVLLTLLGDDDERVQAAAAAALLEMLGAKRALPHVLGAGTAAQVRFAEDVVLGPELAVSVWALEKLASDGDEACLQAVREAAEWLLRDGDEGDDADEHELRARLGALAAECET